MASLEAPAAPLVARLFQLVAFCVYAFTIYYSILYVHIPPRTANYAIAGKAKFLTQWNLCLCGIYFGLCVLLNILPFRRLFWLREFLLCSISLPSCIFVSTVFWGLYAIDRELIFPKGIERYYPNWVNHCSHSLIAATAIIESLIYPHHPPSKRVAFGGLLVWFTTYLLWVLYLGLVHEVWVYPVMQVLSPVGLTAFFIVCFIMVFALHVVARNIIGLRANQNGSNEKSRKRM